MKTMINKKKPKTNKIKHFYSLKQYKKCGNLNEWQVDLWVRFEAEPNKKPIRIDEKTMWCSEKGSNSIGKSRNLTNTLK